MKMYGYITRSLSPHPSTSVHYLSSSPHTSELRGSRICLPNYLISINSHTVVEGRSCAVVRGGEGGVGMCSALHLDEKKECNFGNRKEIATKMQCLQTGRKLSKLVFLLRAALSYLPLFFFFSFSSRLLFSSSSLLLRLGCVLLILCCLLFYPSPSVSLCLSPSPFCLCAILQVSESQQPLFSSSPTLSLTLLLHFQHCLYHYFYIPLLTHPHPSSLHSPPLPHPTPWCAVSGLFSPLPGRNKI